MLPSPAADETSAGDIFDSRYYRVNKLLMITIGTWPHQRGKDRYVRVVLMTGWILSCMIPQINFIANSADNLDAVIECCGTLLTFVGILIKYYTCIANLDKFAHTMNLMRRNWENCCTEHERRILGTYALIARKRNLMYAGYLYSFTQIFTFASIVPHVLDVIDPLNESRPLQPLLLADYGVDQQNNFFLIWTHGYVASMITMSIASAHDTMHGAYVDHACSVFGVIGYRLENVASSDCRTVVLRPPLEEDVDHQNMVACIRTHKEILEFSSVIQEIYSEPFLWQLLLGAVLVSLALVQCVFKLDRAEELAKSATVVGGHIGHLFFNSVPGQRLMDHSQAVGQSTSNIAWYNMSLRARKLLPLMIMRSATPCYITAGKFYVMCMENFCKVIQTSMSYFTVLTTMR